MTDAPELQTAEEFGLDITDDLNWDYYNPSDHDQLVSAIAHRTEARDREVRIATLKEAAGLVCDLCSSHYDGVTRFEKNDYGYWHLMDSSKGEDYYRCSAKVIHARVAELEAEAEQERAT